MKILYLCSDSGIPVLGHDGASVHVRSLVSALRAEGHAVIVAAPVLNKSPWEEAAALDAHVMHVPVSEATQAAAGAAQSYNDSLGAANAFPAELRRILYNQELETALLRRFAQSPPDVVYERAATFGKAGVALARALHVPLLVELNTPLSLDHSPYRPQHFQTLAGEAERTTLTGADVVLTVSSSLREYALAQGVSPDRVEVMPNGIDDRLFVPGEVSGAAREKWGIGPGPVLGFVGGMRPWHGVRVLPDLLARLAGRYPQVQMVVAGDGPLREEIVEAFRSRGLSGRVVFTGPIAHEEVADLIRVFDVALAPYDDSDHFPYFSPLKLFEYMGCGVPVVASAVGQIREVVTSGCNGVLYPPGDFHALAAACERLLGDAALRQRIGSAGAVMTHESFTWGHNAARVVELAQALADRPTYG